MEFQWNINSLPHTQSGKVNIAQELGSREYCTLVVLRRGADLTLEWRSLKQRRRMEDFIWRHIFASFGPFIHHTSVSPFPKCFVFLFDVAHLKVFHLSFWHSDKEKQVSSHTLTLRENCTRHRHRLWCLWQIWGMIISILINWQTSWKYGSRFNSILISWHTSWNWPIL